MPLIRCTADPYDGLRLNAAVALKHTLTSAVVEVMLHLVSDPNPRVRLIGAGTLLSVEPKNTQACAVVAEALAHPDLRVRKAALELVESLGPGQLRPLARIIHSSSNKEAFGSV